MQPVNWTPMENLRLNCIKIANWKWFGESTIAIRNIRSVVENQLADQTEERTL